MRSLALQWDCPNRYMPGWRSKSTHKVFTVWRKTTDFIEFARSLNVTSFLWSFRRVVKYLSLDTLFLPVSTQLDKAEAANKCWLNRQIFASGFGLGFDSLPTSVTKKRKTLVAYGEYEVKVRLQHLVFRLATMTIISKLPHLSSKVGLRMDGCKCWSQAIKPQSSVHVFWQGFSFKSWQLCKIGCMNESNPLAEIRLVVRCGETLCLTFLFSVWC